MPCFIALWGTQNSSRNWVFPTKFVKRNKRYFTYYYWLRFTLCYFFCLATLLSNLIVLHNEISLFITLLPSFAQNLPPFAIWASRLHFNTHKKFPKFSSSLILVKLTISLCAISSFLSSHLSFKIFSRHLLVLLQFSNVCVAPSASSSLAVMVTATCSSRRRRLFRRNSWINRKRKWNLLKCRWKRMVRMRTKRRFVHVRKFRRPHRHLFRIPSVLNTWDADRTVFWCGSGG